MTAAVQKTRRAKVAIAERLGSREVQRHSVPLDILVVDDDDATRLALQFALTDAGHRVLEAADGEEALAHTARTTFDVILLDIHLPKLDGLTVFRRVRPQSPTTAVILMTAFATVKDAVAALREGAYDYVTKPFDPEEFSLRVIGHISEHRALKQELEEARKLVASREAGSPIIGHSPSMVQLLDRIATVAQSKAPVFIRGDAGTGKDLVAHTLHARGPRKAAPFVVVGCAAFAEKHIETEIFGHGPKEGLLKKADGGTVLVDDISMLPGPVQAKLLRVLEDGMVTPIGATDSYPVDVRFLATTRRDPKELVASGELREDLFYRINVVDLTLPPLRERRSDLPLLLAHFLRKYYPGRVPPGIAGRAWNAIMEYDFPGNVREFGHAIERAVVLSHGSEIDLEHLPSDIAGSLRSIPVPGSILPLRNACEEFEKKHVLRAMTFAEGSHACAAELLGISSEHLVELLQTHGLMDDFPSSRAVVGQLHS